MSLLTLPDAPTTALAVAVALAVDRLWGEPPPRLHPVVWMGQALAWAGRRIAPTPEEAPAGRDVRAWLAGAAAWWVLALACAAVAAVLQALVQVLAQGAPGALGARGLPAGGTLVPARVEDLVQGLALGLLLKPLLAHRMLCDEVRAVEAALQQGLEAGRQRLAWLVSREVRTLSEAEVRESAVESLAENLNDSVVAPLFWFALAGLPGAALYRLANTADAMWGYRGERGGRVWTWAGRWAARADDALSWLPARLTALVLWPALLHPVGGWARARQLAREARQTPSPNSGWPMAALALRLGLRLSKPGVYTLHPSGRSPQPADVARALDVAQKMALALFAVALAAFLLGAGWQGGV